MSGDLVLQIEQDELKEWLASSTTKKVLQALEQYVQDYEKSYRKGSTLDLTSVEKTALQTVNLVSFCEGVTFVTHLDELLDSEEGENKEDA